MTMADRSATNAEHSRCPTGPASAPGPVGCPGLLTTDGNGDVDLRERADSNGA